MPPSSEELTGWLRTLRRELQRIALLGAALLVALALMLSVPEGSATSLRWLLASLAGWGFVLWQCTKRLHLNVSTVSNHVFATLGLGNRITLLRGLLIAATAGFLAIFPMIDARLWLFYVPAALYTVAALLDGLDGHVARRRQQTTQLGTELDTALDAFGLLIAPVFAVLTGKLPASYLLVSAAYYLFQWGIQWRQWRGRPVLPLPPSRTRRYLAGLQMALVAIALWPPLPAGMTRAMGIALMIPLLLGFCRDWLYVSGRLGTGRGQAS
jgi:CDP-diacylglycerol--glycerol-3-phosphate 3-phosphatidyltransferase